MGASLPVLASIGASAIAFTRDSGSAPSVPSGIVESRSLVGLGFGFAPWWGPYDYYPPPPAPPPPLYMVPAGPSPMAVPRGAVPTGPAAAPAAPGACRRFESPIIVNGQQRLAKGLACQRPDGTWRIVQ